LDFLSVDSPSLNALAPQMWSVKQSLTCSKTSKFVTTTNTLMFPSLSSFGFALTLLGSSLYLSLLVWVSSLWKHDWIRQLLDFDPMTLDFHHVCYLLCFVSNLFQRSFQSISWLNQLLDPSNN
jgi:hypothetical protein